MKRFLLGLCLCLAVAAVYAAPALSADGKELYTKCQGCHGPDASKLIKSKSEPDILKALHGYKDKTYGGDRKAMMENIVKNMSDEDMKAVADYMSKL